MPIAPLSDEARLQWLRLSRSEQVGAITFRRLLERFGTIEEAIHAAPELAKRGGGKKPLVIMARDAAEQELAALHKLGGFMLASCEPDYPLALREIEDAPPLIAVLGRRAMLRAQTMLAVVGSRNASLNGRQFTRQLAQACGQAGLVVVSGLARGIDTAAHEGALAHGSLEHTTREHTTREHTTVAVVAGGIDVVYPEENRRLYQQIVEQGVVVAESPFGTPPTKQHFPKRNRIISGLSAGVVVVEAVQQSGSLITARLALEQGREVFAVPGSPLDPRAKGNNALLREGAILVENIQDILAGLGARQSRSLAEPSPPVFAQASQKLPDEAQLHHARSRILASLGYTPTPIDSLIADTGLPTPLILAALLELELAGRVQRQPGQLVALVAEA